MKQIGSAKSISLFSDSLLGYSHYDDGPNRAIFDFLAETRGRYLIDTEYCDYYGHNVTYNTNGYLKKLAH